MPVITDTTLLTSSEACDRSGLSFRVLDYLCRQGAIRPSVVTTGSGVHRGWTPDEVERLCRIADVRAHARAAGFDITCDAVAAMWDALADGRAWTLTLDL